MIELYFDGGTRGNRICYVKKSRTGPKEYIKIINTPQTNNQMEYSALLLGLRSIDPAEEDKPKMVSIIGDSQLVIRHMTGYNKIRSLKLLDLYEQVLEEIKHRHLNALFYWVPRDENLAGIVLDRLK